MMRLSTTTEFANWFPSDLGDRRYDGSPGAKKLRLRQQAQWVQLFAEYHRASTVDTQLVCDAIPTKLDHFHVGPARFVVMEMARRGLGILDYDISGTSGKTTYLLPLLRLKSPGQFFDEDDAESIAAINKDICCLRTGAEPSDFTDVNLRSVVSF